MKATINPLLLHSKIRYLGPHSKVGIYGDSDESLRILVGNSYRRIACGVQAEVSGTDGAWLSGPQILGALMSSNPELTATLEIDESKAHYECGGVVATIPLVADPEQFDEMPDMPHRSPSAVVKADLLKRAINNTKGVASRTHDYMSGIGFIFDGLSLRVVATDGRRIVDCSINASGSGSFNASLMPDYIGSLVDDDGDMEITIGDSWAGFDGDNSSMAVRVCEARFADMVVKEIAKRENIGDEVKVQLGPLSAAAKIIQSVVLREGSPCLIELKDGQIVLSVATTNSSLKIPVPCDSKLSKRVMVSSLFFHQAMASCQQDENVAIRFGDEHDAIIVKSLGEESYTSTMILPLRIFNDSNPLATR